MIADANIICIIGRSFKNSIFRKNEKNVTNLLLAKISSHTSMGRRTTENSIRTENKKLNEPNLTIIIMI